MTPEERIKTALNGVNGLAGRVYPLEGLKNASAPFAFYLRRTEDEDEALDGPTGLQEGTFEVNIVARSYADLVTLAGEARSVLLALRGTAEGGLYIERAIVRMTSPDLKEKEVNLYRRMYILQLNYQKEDSEHE